MNRNLYLSLRTLSIMFTITYLILSRTAVVHALDMVNEQTVSTANQVNCTYNDDPEITETTRSDPNEKECRKGLKGWSIHWNNHRYPGFYCHCTWDSDTECPEGTKCPTVSTPKPGFIPCTTRYTGPQFSNEDECKKAVENLKNYCNVEQECEDYCNQKGPDTPKKPTCAPIQPKITCSLINDQLYCCTYPEPTSAGEEPSPVCDIIS